jgi:hypothetical protein
VGGKVFGVLGFVLGLTLVIALLVLANSPGFESYFDHQTVFVKKSLGIGLAVVALLALDLIGFGLTFLLRTNPYFARSAHLNLGRLVWLSTVSVVSVAALIALLPMNQDISAARLTAPTRNSGIVPAYFSESR